VVTKSLRRLRHIHLPLHRVTGNSGVVPHVGTAPRRALGDLRRAAPADDTTRNLLELMCCKLDLCAQLGVFELEAGSEGHEASATLFHELAAVERDSFERLKRRLIAEMEASGTVAEPPMPTAGGSR